MNKKELSNAIEEGILKGFWKPLWLFIIILLCFVFAISLFFVIGDKYQDWKCHKEGNCPVYQTQDTSCFILEKLRCSIIEINESRLICEGRNVVIEFNRSAIASVSLGDEKCMPSERTLSEKSVCGYQEANAYFDNFKLNYNGNLIMECN